MPTMTNNSSRSGSRHGVFGSQAYTSPGLKWGQEATKPASLQCLISQHIHIITTTINNVFNLSVLAANTQRRTT